MSKSKSIRVSAEFYDYLMGEYDRMKRDTPYFEDVSFIKATKVLAKNYQQQKQKGRTAKPNDMGFIKF
jgi:hypothetical protein